MGDVQVNDTIDKKLFEIIINESETSERYENKLLCFLSLFAGLPPFQNCSKFIHRTKYYKLTSSSRRRNSIFVLVSASFNVQAIEVKGENEVN